MNNFFLILVFLTLLYGNQSTTNTTSRIVVKDNPNPNLKSKDKDISIDYIQSSNTNEENNNELDYIKSISHRSLVESIIRKNSFSSNKRLLMFAGLEGVGHHAISNMFDVCINVTNNISIINNNYNIVINGKCLPVPELTTTLMFANTTNRSGLFFATDASKAGIYVKTIKNIMTSLNNQKENNNLSSLYIIGNDHPTTSGMLSYPNFGDPHKPLNHPDISVIARLAELVGLDFRIIVLQRSADEILMSTKNRRFGGPKEGRILSDNAAALYSQLKLLDPKFFHCVNYHDLSSFNGNKRKDFIEFTHPFIETILPKMLETIHSKPEIRTSHDFIQKMNNRSNLHQDSIMEMRQYLTNNYDVHNVAVRLQLISNICPNQ